MRRISIGDFSRMTHLSIKALRHYHDIGLLEPAEIDERTGYRYYEAAQAQTAQVIKRFRAMGMPTDDLRALLAAHPAERNRLVEAHLAKLTDHLAETQAGIDTLRALLTPAPSVEHRTLPEIQALAISERVSLDGFSVWWKEAFQEIRSVLHSAGLTQAGTPGGLYATELFSEEKGDAVVFVPVRGRPAGADRVRLCTIPKADLAVAVHVGSHDDIDRAYSALGAHVVEHEIGVDGPIREQYVVDRFASADPRKWRTEIGWPIFRTG